MRGESSIAELCRREGINSNLYYRWSKDFLEAGKKRLSGDTIREANSDARFSANDICRPKKCHAKQSRMIQTEFSVTQNASAYLGHLSISLLLQIEKN
jgi:transposase-like protein